MERKRWRFVCVLFFLGRNWKMKSTNGDVGGVFSYFSLFFFFFLKIRWFNEGNSAFCCVLLLFGPFGEILAHCFPKTFSSKNQPNKSLSFDQGFLFCLKVWIKNGMFQEKGLKVQREIIERNLSQSPSNSLKSFFEIFLGDLFLLGNRKPRFKRTTNCENHWGSWIDFSIIPPKAHKLDGTKNLEEIGQFDTFQCGGYTPSPSLT